MPTAGPGPSVRSRTTFDLTETAVGEGGQAGRARRRDGRRAPGAGRAAQVELAVCARTSTSSSGPRLSAATSPPTPPSSTPAGAATSLISRPGRAGPTLATVIDIASMRVVGFALADHLRTELIALLPVQRGRGPRPGTRHDLPLRPRLPSTTSAAYAAHRRRVPGSPSRSGGPASAGTTRWPSSFFSSLKGELIDTRHLADQGRSPAGGPWSTSAGTTAPGCTHHSATKARGLRKQPP